ncbi:hypothetical protein QBC39DRAFT_300528 [Podospora conica]|nr:hypothetical protein QBC39DRAFT_300528 [Schizothecium conicum]
MTLLATVSGQYPKTERSPAFTLIANITDTSKLGIFSDPIQHWPLDDIHTGAARNTAVLRSDSRNLFFVNGTAEQEAAMNTTVRLPPLMCSYGQDPDSNGVMFGQSTIKATGYVGINNGGAHQGAGIFNSFQSPYPALYAPEPFRSLKWMVCNQSEHDHDLPQYAVKQAEEVPENCAEMVLLAQCATLRPLPLLNVTQWGWNVREVDCYSNVSAIDWDAF